MNNSDIRILLVDDEPDILEIVGYNLRNEGYEVHLASNGADAVRTAKKVTPHLILLDIMMPEISGLQVSRTIKEESGYQSLPIILVSAIDRLKDEQLKSSKADDIIYKPFDMDNLLLKVAELVP